MIRRDFIKTITATGLYLSSKTLLANEDKRPNILWLSCEDSNVTWIGCYGNPEATTPNIDKLAREGFRYTNAFASAPVCAPSRSTWITGINAVSMGTHPMRSRYDIPHDKIKYYPDYLREAGYYCSNHTKTDYNIGGRPDRECWNSTATYAWQKRKPNQPFFGVINNADSHESKAFGDVNNTKHDPNKVILHKYHPDVVDIRKNYAHYEDAVEKMDRGIGESLAQLEKDGLADDTIVIFCSDHGGVLPRSKRFLFDSGIHSPFIIRIPEKYKYLWPAEKPGMTVDRLVSFVDMPKTWLSITGAQVPSYMQGRIFLGPNKEPEAKFHFAFRGRMDERYDEIRAVRDKQFLYIKNYMPYVPWGQHLNYLWNMVATRAWQTEYDAHRTDDITGRFFKPKPFVEELYDTTNDQDNICNLSSNPEYQNVLESMRKQLHEWQISIYDSGLLPENDMVKRAEDNKTTIYDMIRNPELYDLPAYLDAADVALKQSNANKKILTRYLHNKDSAIRYWGVTGLVMLNKLDSDTISTLKEALADESHEVRAIAAWCLIKEGEKDIGRTCLIDLIEKNSYARLKVLNIIDWMKDDKSVYMPAIKAMTKPTGYESRMQKYLIES